MLVLLSNHVEILSRSLLASFLDCVGKAGRYASSFAQSHGCGESNSRKSVNGFPSGIAQNIKRAGAGEMVLDLVVV
jgi:hypothetical protein